MERVVAIHQPNYIPGLRFFAKMAACDVFVFLDSVPYSKNNWTNRNRIRTANGVQWLTVPVVTSGRFQQLINEVEAVADARWKRAHVRTLREAYARAPFRNVLTDLVESCYSTGDGRLAELNIALIGRLSAFLGIRCEILRSSQLKVSGSGTGLLVDICRRVDASVYLSGQGGRKYLEEERFGDAGIRVRWQNYVYPVYPQVHGEFVPDLSIVDLVANCGPESLQVLQDGIAE